MKKNEFFNNKVVLITGSSMGIGKELALQVLQNNGKAIITARSAEKLIATEKEFEPYKNSLMVFQGDITNEQTNLQLLNEIIKRFGQLDVLITNAGLSCYGKIGLIQPNVAKSVIDTNIYGTLFPVSTCLSTLQKSNGSIMLISSLAGLRGLPGYSAYSLSKMALTAMAQSLKIELKSSNVKIGIAYLGFTENETEKRTLNPNGQFEVIPPRPSRLVVSREITAYKILKQIADSKFSKTHTPIGVLTLFLSRYFPGLLSLILTKNYFKKTL